MQLLIDKIIEEFNDRKSKDPELKNQELSLHLFDSHIPKDWRDRLYIVPYEGIIFALICIPSYFEYFITEAEDTDRKRRKFVAECRDRLKEKLGVRKLTPITFSQQIRNLGPCWSKFAGITTVLLTWLRNYDKYRWRNRGMSHRQKYNLKHVDLDLYRSLYLLEGTLGLTEGEGTLELTGHKSGALKRKPQKVTGPLSKIRKDQDNSAPPIFIPRNWVLLDEREQIIEAKMEVYRQCKMKRDLSLELLKNAKLQSGDSLKDTKMEVYTAYEQESYLRLVRFLEIFEKKSKKLLQDKLMTTIYNRYDMSTDCRFIGLLKDANIDDPGRIYGKLSKLMRNSS